MAAASGLWNHSAVAQANAMGTTGMARADATGDSTNSDAGNSATISANDFLTLLVTEMQNQDPTATTDPNEYINQLVQVNSLEQLISINQNLSTALGTSDSQTNSSTEASKNGAAAAKRADAVGGHVHPGAHSNAVPRAQTDGMGIAGVNGNALHAAAGAGGNLSVPAVNPAALRVAQSLSGEVYSR